MSTKLLLSLMGFRSLGRIGKSCNMNLIRMVSNEDKNKYASVKNMKLQLADRMGVPTGYNPIPEDRSNLIQYLPATQEELPKRTMADSYVAGLIPLSTDKKLQDKYVTFLGRVRVGRLLEDMDIFAVMLAFKHIVNPKQPKDKPFAHTLVTALVDRIDFTEYVPKPRQDIKISGQVSWVGSTSMEVTVWLEQEMSGIWHRMTRALFVLAARDSINANSAIVNPLEPANDRDRKILSGGEERKRKRIMLAKQHVSKVMPDEQEQKLVYDLYLRTTRVQDISSVRKKTLPPGCVWMGDWTLSNIIFSHPEDRNLHNTIFGGFIMRQAEELSWVLGYMYGKYRPVLKSISDINFQKPVAVGSLIQMHAYVVFTQMNFIQISVFAETNDPTTGKSDQTNTFHFTYEVPELVNECVPFTYHEAMMFVDGRRHFLEIMNIQANTEE